MGWEQGLRVIQAEPKTRHLGMTRGQLIRTRRQSPNAALHQVRARSRRRHRRRLTRCRNRLTSWDGPCHEVLAAILQQADFAVTARAFRTFRLESNPSRIPIKIRNKLSPLSQCFLQLCEDQLEDKLSSTSLAVGDDISIFVQQSQNGQLLSQWMPSRVH